MRPASSTAVLLVSLSGCLDASPGPETPEAELSFWLETRLGVMVGDAVGPLWDGQRPTDPVVLAADERLLELQLPVAPLEARCNTTRDLLMRSLSLARSSVEVGECLSEGILRETQLELPLAAVEHQALALDLDRRRFEPVEAPPDLSLRLVRTECAGGRSVNLRSFTAEPVYPLCEDSSCPVTALQHLDEDTLVVVAGHKLALVRRGAGALEPGQDLAFDGLLPPVPDADWHAQGMALDDSDWPAGPAAVLVVFELERRGAARSEPVGGAIARVTFEPSGRVRSGELVAHEVDLAAAPLSLRAVLTTPSGGFMAVGRGLVVTATDATAGAQLRRLPGFSAEVLLALPEAPDRFLAADKARQVYEGSFQEGITLGTHYAIEDSSNLGFQSATTVTVGGERRILLGGTDGSLRVRLGPKRWGFHDAHLDEPALPCAGASRRCGRLVPTDYVRSLTSFGAQAEHVLFSLVACEAVFLRVQGDPCAVGVAIDDQGIRTSQSRSLRASSGWSGRAVIGLRGPRLAELSFD